MLDPADVTALPPAKSYVPLPVPPPPLTPIPDKSRIQAYTKLPSKIPSPLESETHFKVRWLPSAV